MKSIKTKKFTFLYKEPEKTPATRTIFFFSLSAIDSLTLPPFCHPVDTLVKNGARVVSVTLPAHENNRRPYHIQDIWLKEKETLKTFIKDLTEGIKELKEHFPPPYGTMGISRGAFIALHTGALIKDITTITCFAPLLSLKEEKDLCVQEKASLLANKKIYFFVGDTDTLIGTEKVINFYNTLSKLSESKDSIKIKISPSIGRYGHGTSDENFTEGALWLIKNL